MAVSRFFGKPLVAHCLAQQRHAAGHAKTLAANGLVVVQDLLEGGLQLGGVAPQLGFQVVRQSHSGASLVGDGQALYPHLITNPPKTKRYRLGNPTTLITRRMLQ